MTPVRFGRRSKRPSSRDLGWMLWNAKSNVTIDALLPDE